MKTECAPAGRLRSDRGRPTGRLPGRRGGGWEQACAGVLARAPMTEGSLPFLLMSVFGLDGQNLPWSTEAYNFPYALAVRRLNETRWGFWTPFLRNLWSRTIFVSQHWFASTSEFRCGQYSFCLPLPLLVATIFLFPNCRDQSRDDRDRPRDRDRDRERDRDRDHRGREPRERERDHRDRPPSRDYRDDRFSFFQSSHGFAWRVNKQQAVEQQLHSFQ